MSTHYTVFNLIFRVVLDFIAAALIGINRDERGRPAGLRTNILVSLAACIAMIQTNLLINSTGRPTDSFVVMDIMRLPLGILSGIGFIGAGAIIKRGDIIVGVTTAATLWFVTVMGLCFGGGQIWLGLGAFVLGIGTLTVLRRIEVAVPTEHRGNLTITTSKAGDATTEIEFALRAAGLTVTNYVLRSNSDEWRTKTLRWHVRWSGRRENSEPPAVIRTIQARSDVTMLEFRTLM